MIKTLINKNIIQLKGELTIKELKEKIKCAEGLLGYKSDKMEIQGYLITTKNDIIEATYREYEIANIKTKSIIIKSKTEQEEIILEKCKNLTITLIYNNNFI